MRRRSVIVLLGLTATAGCLSGTDETEPRRSSDVSSEDDPDPDKTVYITEEPAFDPDLVEINVGETVMWTNNTTMLPTVTAYESDIPDNGEYFASGGYNSETFATIIYPFGGALESGESFDHTFETEGTYHYYSISPDHPRIEGIVEVN